MSAGMIIAASAAFICAALLAHSCLRAFAAGISGYEQKYLSKTAQALDEMFLPVNPEQILYLNLASIAAAFLAGLLLSGSAVAGFASGAAGALVPRVVLNRMKRGRLDRFDEQLVDALGSLSGSMKAGLSFIQAVEFVARESSAPLSQEFGILVREVGLGSDPDVALKNMANRVKSRDLELVVTSILVVRSVGGNLTEMLDKIASTIRERNTIKGKIRTLTAQGRLQGIVIGCLPVILGVLLYYIEPRMVRVLFSDPIGWIIIGVIIIFEAIGAFFIRKIVSIEV